MSASWIGKRVTVKGPYSGRELLVCDQVGVVQDVYNGRASVVFVVTSKVGSPEEYGVFVELDRLIPFEEEHPIMRKFSNDRPEPEPNPGLEFTFLTRQARRLTSWLFNEGYQRWEVAQDDTSVVVWSKTPGEALEAAGRLLNGVLFVRGLCTCTPTKIQTFTEADIFVEATYTGQLEVL
jgi:hypothetical protein